MAGYRWYYRHERDKKRIHVWRDDWQGDQFDICYTEREFKEYQHRIISDGDSLEEYIEPDDLEFLP